LNSFNRYIGAEEASFYLFENNALKLMTEFGWKDYHRRPERYELGKGLIGRAAAKMKTCRIKEIVFGETLSNNEISDMAGDSLLAVPVLDQSNKLFGVASIEKISLLKMTETTIQTAKIICELAAQSLNYIDNINRLKNKQIKDEATGLYHYNYFLIRVEEEIKRSKAYKLPLAIVEFKWPGLTEPSMLRSTIAIIKVSLRELDVLAIGPNADIPLILILPTTNKDDASLVTKKIIERLDSYGLSHMISEKDLKDTITVTDLETLDLKRLENI